MSILKILQPNGSQMNVVDENIVLYRLSQPSNADLYKFECDFSV